MNLAPAAGRGVLARLFFSPGERRLRTFWRITLIVILLAAFTLAFSIPLVFINMTGFAAVVVAQLAGTLAATAAVFVSRRYIDRRSISSLGLQPGPRIVVDLVIGILIMGVMMGLIYLAESSAGWLRYSGAVWDSLPPAQILLEIVLPALLLFVSVGWVEELIFRGYLLKNLADGINIGWALVLTSAAFALVHALNPGVTPIALVGLLLAGLFLGYAALRTGQLWLPVGLHIGWNFFEGPVFGFPVSGLDIPRLVQQQETGPDLWTGGAFGPEAGLGVIPALVLGAVLIHLYSRHRAKLGLRKNILAQSGSEPPVV